MFFQRQARLRIFLNSVLVLLTILCMNISYAQQSGASASINLRKLDNRTTVNAYRTLSASAMRAFMKHLINPSDTEELEKLVVMSNEFIVKFPTSEQVIEVNYYLGKALVQLERVETGIATLEKVVRNTPPDYVAVTRYSDEIGDALKWSPLEHSLLELGLAYDKHNQHDKAETVYKKLIAHPEFANGLQAGIARQILKLDTASRIGEVPTAHNAWIGQMAINFQMQQGTDRRQTVSLNQYAGQIVLLYYDKADTQNLNLKQIHNKHKDQKFQIISVNPGITENPMVNPGVANGDTWIHFRDTHGKIADMNQIRTLPAVFLLDSEGVVRATQLEAASLDKAVDALVKENLATYDDPRIQAIVAKTVVAHGGLEKLRGVENILMNVRIFEYFPDGTFEEEGYGKAYHYPDKYRTEFYTNDGERYIQLFDSTSLYISEDGKLEQAPHEDAKYIIDRYKDTAFREPIWLLTKLAQNEIPIQYLGTDTVNDESAVVLRVRQPSGKPLKIFISEKTHLIVQFVFGNGRVDSVLSLEQYKEVDGIKISHHTIFKNESHNEIFFVDISFNAEIAPKLFDVKK